ncbi:MAG: hypothetical protein KZQ90_12160 [Candidatus Thiodiazotropha sp. (ex Codakia rugifera)]|nr:hypothetical protein [Candidatus Thiodiazotropha sp. (ex Codakia rugifera)]
MFQRFRLISLLLLFFWQIQAYGVNDTQLAAIKALGELNGIALQCNALPDTQRIKRALVLALPKRRQLGELFDYHTNKSFMAFINEKGTCPSPQSLAQQVDEALERLEAAYATQ